MQNFIFLFGQDYSNVSSSWNTLDMFSHNWKTEYSICDFSALEEQLNIVLMLVH